jgi:hypothetical protein
VPVLVGAEVEGAAVVAGVLPDVGVPPEVGPAGTGLVVAWPVPAEGAPADTWPEEDVPLWRLTGAAARVPEACDGAEEPDRVVAVRDAVAAVSAVASCVVPALSAEAARAEALGSPGPVRSWWKEPRGPKPPASTRARTTRMRAPGSTSSNPEVRRTLAVQTRPSRISDLS